MLERDSLRHSAIEAKGHAQRRFSGVKRPSAGFKTLIKVEMKA